MNTLQFKNSFRFLLKKKNYLLINLVGLGIGIAAFLVLFLYVYNDFTYNHLNKNLSNIYRVREGNSVQTKGLLLPKMLEQIPEVENGTRLFDWDWFRLSYAEKAFEENIQYVDTGFFSVFTFPFSEGSAIDGVQEKYGAVVSKAFAEKYFGNEYAVGKKLQVGFDNTFLQVNGVVDIPVNSSIQFDIVTSYGTGETISPWIKGIHDWYNTFSSTYVLLKPGINPQAIDGKMQQIVTENFFPVGESKTDLNLLAFKDYHKTEESNQTLIIILSIVALGILGIAVVNFINLTITNSLSRIKEIGIKKVVGAGKWFLAWQIILESLMVSFVAVVVGCLLALLFLPTFNQLFDTQLLFNPLQNAVFLIILGSVWLIVGFLSGFAPALFLARSKLIQSLQGQIFSGGKLGMGRYSLIVVQFVIALILISGTFFVRKQINFMMKQDPKFDKENVVVAKLTNWEFEDQQAVSQKYKIIAENLKKSPYVESVCFSNVTPGNYQGNYNNFFPGNTTNTKQIHLRKAYVGRDYFKTYGIKILSGNGFDEEEMNYKQNLVLNKKAMHELGFSDADNQILRESSATGTPNRVIGEVEDFSYQGAQHEMQPLAHIFSERENYSDWNYLSVKARSGASLQVVQLLKDEWENVPPQSTVSSFFADEKLNEQYNEYVKINEIVAWFSLVAIVLSCIGLFALSAYAMSRRTKEVGVRKVNGAKIGEVMVLLNRDFLRWVAISLVIAIPLSWFAMNKWLESFALKTTLNWWIFALAGLLVLFIALFTVSWQSWKAATRNPVEALRYE